MPCPPPEPLGEWIRSCQKLAWTMGIGVRPAKVIPERFLAEKLSGDLTLLSEGLDGATYKIEFIDIFNQA
jgi:hypothetical protein